MVASQHHEKFGIATYVKDDLLPSTALLPSTNSFWAGIKLNGISIINVYKPPSADFDDQVFPSFEKPSVVIGDFNSHNTFWGYESSDRGGTRLFDWMTREDYSLGHNATDPGTFRSARYNRSY